MPLDAALCRLVPSRECKWASAKGSISASEAGGRAFESRPGHHFFRGLTALRADGEIAGGRIGPFGDAEIGERQVLGLLWDGVGVDPKRERRVRMTELV